MVMQKTKFKLSKEKQKILHDYIEYKKTFVRTKSKMDGYILFISSFLENSKKNLKDYGEIEIINFINSISKKYAVSTMNEIKIMIKSFICWHYEDFSKRFRNLDKICAYQKTEKTYSPEQMLKKEDIEKLVQEEPEMRWKSFFLLYFYGGFRPIEVCQLKWKDITFDKEGCFIKIISKKNHREFQKYVPENVCFYLRKLKERNYSSEYIFPTKRTNKHGISVGDKPMTRSGVYQHLIPLAKRVLNRHVNPYILRHSIATILYNRDDIKDDDAAQQLGHSKAMKQTYNNLSIDKIRERMKRIYIESEILPKEKRLELENEIEFLKKENELFKGDIEGIKELIQKISLQALDNTELMYKFSEKAKRVMNKI